MEDLSVAKFVKTMAQVPGSRPEWINLDYVVSVVDEGARYALYMSAQERGEGFGDSAGADHYVAKKDLKLP
jgi:hypothetical protein